MAEKNYMLQKNDSNRYLQLSEYEVPEIPEPPEQDDNTFLEDCGIVVKEKKVGYLTVYYPFGTFIYEDVEESETSSFNFTFNDEEGTFEGVLKTSVLEKVNSRIGSQYGQSRPLSISSNVDEIKLVITGKNHKLEDVTETITSDISGDSLSATTNFYKEITSIQISGSVPSSNDGTEAVTLGFAPVFKLDNFNYKYVKDNASVSVEYTNAIDVYTYNIGLLVDDSSETPNETAYIVFKADITDRSTVFDDTVLPSAMFKIVEI